jgi:hypothetical protein
LAFQVDIFKHIFPPVFCIHFLFPSFQFGLDTAHPGFTDFIALTTVYYVTCVSLYQDGCH